MSLTFQRVLLKWLPQRNLQTENSQIHRIRSTKGNEEEAEACEWCGGGNGRQRDGSVWNRPAVLCNLCHEQKTGDFWHKTGKWAIRESELKKSSEQSRKDRVISDTLIQWECIEESAVSEYKKTTKENEITKATKDQDVKYLAGSIHAFRNSIRACSIHAFQNAACCVLGL